LTRSDVTFYGVVATCLQGLPLGQSERGMLSKVRRWLGSARSKRYEQGLPSEMVVDLSQQTSSLVSIVCLGKYGPRGWCGTVKLKNPLIPQVFGKEFLSCKSYSWWEPLLF